MLICHRHDPRACQRNNRRRHIRHKLHGQGSEDEDAADLLAYECLFHRGPVREFLGAEEGAFVGVLGHPTGDRTGEVSGHRKEADNHLVALLSERLGHRFLDLAPAHIELDVRGRDEQEPEDGSQ